MNLKITHAHTNAHIHRPNYRLFEEINLKIQTQAEMKGMDKDNNSKKWISYIN